MTRTIETTAGSSGAGRPGKFYTRFSPANMRDKIGQSVAGYPRQFWLLCFGALIGSFGVGLIWPFVSIYARQQFAAPLAAIGLVDTLRSVTGAATNTVIGPLVDRFGRKLAIIVGQVTIGIAFLGMSVGGSLQLWAVWMIALSAFWPFFLIGYSTMIADLVGSERRAGAFALSSVINSVGMMVGTSIGGFVTDKSYTLAFYGGAGFALCFALLVLFFINETMPQKQTDSEQVRSGGGYGQVLRDKPFLIFCGAYALLMSCVATRGFLPIYAKENFGVPESRYGLMLSASSAMTVLFQYSITRIAERYSRLRVLVVSALLYTLGVGSIAWGWSFWTFLASSLIVTLGALLVSPAASAFTADLASPEIRGRYMGVFNLTLWIGAGVGPVVGGLLNDRVAPVATWYGGLAMGLGATLGFILLPRVRQRDEFDNVK